MFSWNELLAAPPLWPILFVFLAVLLYIYGKQPFQVWNELGVPGPRPSPFIGNMFEMFDDRTGTMVAIKKWQKQYGRIFGMYFFRDPCLVVTDPEALKHIFVKDFSNFTDRYMQGRGNLQQRIIKKGVFFEDGSDWKRIRKIMSPTFSSGKLRMLTHYMSLTARRLSDNLCQCVQEGKPAAAKNVFGAFTLDVVCGTAFGLDTNSQADPSHPFYQYAKRLMTFTKILQLKLALVGMFPALGRLFKLLKWGFFDYPSVKFFQDNISALIKERKSHSHAHNHMDFLQLLINAEAENTEEEFVGDKKLTTEEITAQGIIFIIAGYETTSSTLQFLAWELAQNPDIQARIVSEIKKVLGESAEPDYDSCQNLKYTEAVINETLRKYPPVHLLSRVAEKATILNGVPVPAQAAILIPVSNIGRDPEFYHEPDSFQPERFLDSAKKEMNPCIFLPFGHGPRSCIGLRLAMIKIKIALVYMLRNVRIVGATPDILHLEDYTGVLVPRTPILLQLESVRD